MMIRLPLSKTRLPLEGRHVRILPSGEAASPGLDPGEFAGGGMLVQSPPPEMLRLSFRGRDSSAVADRPSTLQGGGEGWGAHLDGWARQGFRKTSSSTHPIIAALVCCFILGGCGFHPLYGRDSVDPQSVTSLSTVYVEPIPDRVGYQLRNDLLDLFNATGEAGNAAYRLRLSLTETEQVVGLQTNTAITRYNYMLTAHYELIPAGRTEPAKMGEVSTLTAYNVAAAPFLYATVTAERDAKDRAANDLAELIRTELAVYLRRSAEKTP
jgi:LPS-assembly lipoprotein